MTSVISSTYDSKYFYFIPLCVWAWNKLGVDVICFLPAPSGLDNEQLNLARQTFKEQGATVRIEHFVAQEQKKATYSQCSRLYGACLGLPEDTILTVGDVDMLMFQKPPYVPQGGITVFGSDLTPEEQFPMCYLTGGIKDWIEAMEVKGRGYQQCLDDLVGVIECQDFRGCQWSLDQDTAAKLIKKNSTHTLIKRAREGTQFASRRYDRDDAYILDRLNTDTIDFHMNRPGYEQQNFEIILTILKYHYPQEDFTWLINYTNEYKKLL